jgi:hypothetical protein
MNEMDNCPIKQGFLERILKGEASREERMMVKIHLKSPCSECADTVLGLPAELEKSLILGLLDPPNRMASLTEQEKEDIFRSATSKHDSSTCGVPFPMSGRRGSGKGARFLALAAVILFAIIVLPAAMKLMRSGYWNGVKQGPAAARGGVFLQFLVITESDKPDKAPTIVRGDNNGRYSEAASLLFRFQLDSPAWLYLVRCGGGDCEVIFPEEDDGPVEQAGFYDAVAGGEILVYPLAHLTGVQTFCAAAYPPSRKSPGAEFSQKRVLQEISRRGTRFENRLRHEWIDCFQIEVSEK